MNHAAYGKQVGHTTMLSHRTGNGAWVVCAPRHSGELVMYHRVRGRSVRVASARAFAKPHRAARVCTNQRIMNITSARLPQWVVAFYVCAQ